MQKRLATYELPIDDSDSAQERAWNDFVDALTAKGLRPSETPIRTSLSSLTFRLFRVDQDLEAEAGGLLDLDIAKLVGKAAMAAGLFAGLESVRVALAHLTWLSAVVA